MGKLGIRLVRAKPKGRSRSRASNGNGGIARLICMYCRSHGLHGPAESAGIVTMVPAQESGWLSVRDGRVQVDALPEAEAGVL